MTHPTNSMRFVFPPMFHIHHRANGDTIQQLSMPEETREVELTEYRDGQLRGVILTDAGQVPTVVIPYTRRTVSGFERILGIKAAGLAVTPVTLSRSDLKTIWLKPEAGAGVPPVGGSGEEYVQRVRDSWHQQMAYLQERRDTQGKVVARGLRPPQIGALHAVLAHWTISSSPATVVMPTGTGKTETMLALLVASQCQRVLVIVPTDPLREQISGKFLSLGVLKIFGVVGAAASYPVVGVLKHKPKNPAEVDAFFQCCNVVVTTIDIAAGCHSSVQQRMAYWCSHLFIDEAHHIPAPTWTGFRRQFAERLIVQFTATPFRNDSQRIDGQIVFNYPLIKAQQEGYFTNINFLPVFEFDERRADATIAQLAVEQLETDLAAGHDHMVMARVRIIRRTEEVLPYYAPHTQYAPVIIHSQLKGRQKEAIWEKIRTRQTRIIICVDMMGEGFDLPELKIAALHDIHKSLGVTLQFTGRFTRTQAHLGEATVIANTADPQVEDTLAELYGEDADWNKILREKGSAAIEEQVKLGEFLKGFAQLPADLSIQNIRPKMSTVIYRMTSTRWQPERFLAVWDKKVETRHIINEAKKVLVIVTKRQELVEWGQIKDVANLIYDLYVVFWDQAQGLLFINSSDTKNYHHKLAEAIGGEVSVVKGDPVFRCFHGLKRVVLQNVGLNKAYAGPLRYIMYTGLDVSEGLTTAHRRNTFKSNLFGQGYENGAKTSVGCSYKGRVWSRQVTNLCGLCDWCSFIGQKVLNDSINVDDVLDGVLKPQLITQRPALMPIVIEWPNSFLSQTESVVKVVFRNQEASLDEVNIELIDPSVDGPLKFALYSDYQRAEYELKIFPNEEGQGFQYVPLTPTHVAFKVGGKKKPLEEWAVDDPPIIRFADSSYLENNLHIGQSNRPAPPYDPRLLMPWSWTGVDLTKESQTEAKLIDSIQYHTITRLKQESYDVLFDDDGSGEVADIVAIREVEQKIVIELYHCKYSHEPTPGARVGDLYEVCGQAQKSIQWRESLGRQNLERVIRHLKRRDSQRTAVGKSSRFEVGDLKILGMIEKKSKHYKSQFKIFIVQPGLSAAQVSVAQLELLGATELYLQETYNIPLGVICSA